MEINHQAFTFRSDKGLFRELITEIAISIPVKIEEKTEKDIHVLNTKALWDTGATGSVITSNSAKELGLKPSGIAKVNHAGGVSDANTYLVNIYLPNHIYFHGVKVTECPDVVGNFGVIIGMDIISQGDFSFTNPKGNSIFSFKLPSSRETDYVDDINLEKKYFKIAQIQQQKGIDKCPCGSGKKYKNCHGKD